MALTNQDIVAEFFDKSCEFNTTSWAASCWESEDDQYDHFSIISSYIRWQRGGSVLDVGCGQGNFYQYVKMRNKEMPYTGVDLSVRMVDKAKERFPRGNFIYQDFLADTFPEQSGIKFDYVVAIGSFNVKVNNQQAHIENCIRKMYDLARVGVAISLTSDKGDSANRFPVLHYYSPSEMLSYCLSLTPRVFLNHGGLGHEMVIYMFPKDI